MITGDGDHKNKHRVYYIPCQSFRHRSVLVKRSLSPVQIIIPTVSGSNPTQPNGIFNISPLPNNISTSNAQNI